MVERDQVTRQVEATGVVFSGRCEIQSAACTARNSAPITAIWELPGRTQVNVCRRCLEEMVRTGEWRIVGARFRPHADVALLNRDHRPVLLVEVKRRPPFRTEPEDEQEAWARRIRRNLLVHGAVPRARYFMVVIFPGRSYLWIEDESPKPDASPVATFDATSDIRSHLRGAASEAELERAVVEWLHDVIDHRDKLPVGLLESGLAEQFEDATVVHQYAA